jgi:hypothetical protein
MDLPFSGRNKIEMGAKARKLALFNEWDEHLRTSHPRQWEREQKKRTRRHAAPERSAQKGNRPQGQ